MSTYIAITQKEATIKFTNLEKQYKSIDDAIDLILIEINKENPRLKLIDNITRKLFDNKQTFIKLKDYFKRLSRLNYTSKMKNRNIFRKIQKIRRFLNISQTGDYVEIQPNVQQVLSLQVNTSTSRLKAEGKVKRIKTNKQKFNFKKLKKLKKLKKNITQRLKPRCKSISKPRKK